MLLTARWILPLAGPPIENGFVALEAGLIKKIGCDKNLQSTRDLGNVILLPGLVNAHAHLEFSKIPPPPLLQRGVKGRFTEWARGMGNPPRYPFYKGGSHGIPPFEKGGLGGIFDRLLRGGTTTVADHAHPESATVEVPFRRIPFWEVLGSSEERAKTSLDLALIRQKQEGGHVSPHSLYAVHRGILDMCAWHAPNALKSIHILESSDEDQYLRDRSGPLWDYVRERDGSPELSPASPINWLAEHEFLDTNLLLVHGNYLNDGEIHHLQGTGASVIHCPGSHQFFGHRKFPLESLREKNIRVALGTDSLASNGDLSMLREMRLLKESYPALKAEEILEMGTLEGALALGMAGEIGSLEVGKRADMVAVPIADEKLGPFENILRAQEICFSMVGGNPLLR